jgi:diguanylate cyclase (GGDEF)-like protein
MARPHRRLGPPKLSYWLRVCTAVILVVFVGGMALIERNGQEEALLHAEDQTATLAHSMAQHASDTIQMADLALVSLSRLLGTEPPTRSKLKAVSLDMDELLQRVPRIRSLDYFEESGWRLTSSDAAASMMPNQSRSPFFNVHKRSADAGLFVGPPMRAGGTGPWLITLSRRIAKDDGSFSGVLIATIESTYFGNFYASFDAGKDIRVALLGAGGELLARNPYDDALIGRNLLGTDVRDQVKAGRSSGTMRMKSPIDGVQRISAFHVVGGTGLMVIFSVSRDSALVPWRQGLYIRISIFVLFASLLVFGGLRLAAQAERRQISENSLLQLSRTDALTGLLNRRAFDEAMATAWLHAIASGKPLSLLMIDVDCFKAFNDTYGHPAGDTCLQIVALSIRNAVRLPDDRVMRYGGEEMAVILPDTSPEQAYAVALKIHARIAELRVSHARSTVAEYVTVSIGCATERRDVDARQTPSDLLADADRALYQAKVTGRDRVVSYERIGQPGGAGTAPIRVLAAVG